MPPQEIRDPFPACPLCGEPADNPEGTPHSECVDLEECVKQHGSFAEELPIVEEETMHDE